MNIKSYLSDYPYINTELQRLQKELNALIQCKHDTYCTLQAVPLTGMPGSHSVSDSVYQNVQVIIDRYDHKISYYTSQINKTLDENALFERVWFNNTVMSNKDRALIELKYFKGRPWSDVARQMNYKVKTCRRQLENVVQKMQCEVDRLSNDIREHTY